MKKRGLIGVLVAVAIGGVSRGAPTTLVSFPAADGLTVWGSYLPGPAGAPVILLFHQADNNKAEYQDIAPRLGRMGYATLAVDARSGSDTYAGDRVNLTAQAYRKKTGETAGYDLAYPDLEAALRWVRQKLPKSAVFVLGSSYSADLVFRLAADHPSDVRAVMSFSPVGGEEALKAAARVKVPVFITSAGNVGEIEDARRVLRAVGSSRKTQFVPSAGPHGALALSPPGNSAAEGYWTALGAFLRTLRELGKF